MLQFADFRLEWLRQHRKGWQYGEQGLIQAMVDHMRTHGAPEFPFRCAVEIGGGDGKSLPLTLGPLSYGGMQVIVYEENQRHRQSLLEVYGEAIEIRGHFGDADELDVDQPHIVLIDVDSIDCVIMDDVLQVCRPTILVVEHYDKAAPHITGMPQATHHVPRWLLGMPLVNNFIIQAPSEHLDTIADQYGYRPVWRTRLNSCYVPRAAIEELYRV